MTLHRYKALRAIGDLRPGDALMHDDVTGDVSLVRCNVMTEAHLNILELSGVVVDNPTPETARGQRAPIPHAEPSDRPRSRSLVLKPARSKSARAHSAKESR